MPLAQQAATQKPRKRKLGAQHAIHGVDPARHLPTPGKRKLGKQRSGARGEKNGHVSNVLAKRKRKSAYGRKTVYEKSSGPGELHARNVVLEKSKRLAKPKRKQRLKLKQRLTLGLQNAVSAGDCAKRR